jgi:hypothetical protein
MADEQMFTTLGSWLKSIGLGALFTQNADGTPGGWLWNQMQQGVDSIDELTAAVESTDVWRNRFGVIVEQRRRSAAGEPVQVMTVGEVISYEETASQMMRQVGLPSWFYDQQSDFSSLILNQISPGELETRLGQSLNMVRNINPAIRDAFSQFYGVDNTDGALAAFFLDPEKSLAKLDQVARASYAKGMADEYDINLSKQQAEELAMMPMTEGGMTDAFQRINDLKPVMQESFGETSDLTAEGEGYDAIVKGDGNAKSRLEKRVIERRSIDQSSQGGAAITQEGVLGVRQV